MEQPNGRRKPISEYKVVQNVTQLVEDKSKFRQWNQKSINAMGQVDPAYEPAIKSIVQWADADASPDLEHGWPGADKVTSLTHGLDTVQVDKGLKNVLMVKAEGTIHTKVVDGEEKGGVYIYVDIYKWFTETSSQPTSS